MVLRRLPAISTRRKNQCGVALFCTCCHNRLRSLSAGDHGPLNVECPLCNNFTCFYLITKLIHCGIIKIRGCSVFVYFVSTTNQLQINNIQRILKKSPHILYMYIQKYIPKKPSEISIKISLRQFDFTVEYVMNVMYHDIIMQTVVNR